ncbi:MAG: glycosyltransferase family 39 protein [Solirubrobacteraceae bacterium]
MPGRFDRVKLRAEPFVRSRYAIPVALFALTAISVLIRIQSIDFKYWLDEALSVGIAGHPLSKLHALLKQDGSPPLYYAVLHFWMQAFGRGEVATHMLSLLFAVLAVPVSYWAAASLFSRRVGLYCAVMIATVPFLTAYAQETRMYSLMLLLSLIATASFLHLFIHRRRRYIPVFALSLAAMLYTHNWGLFFGVVAFIAFLAIVWQTDPVDRRALLRDGAISFGVVALLYLPWVPTLLYQAKHTGAPWALKPDIWSLTQGLYYVVGGRGAAVGLLIGGATGLLAIHRSASKRSAQRTTIYALLALALLTMFFAWVEAKINPSWAPRYEAAIIGPLALLFALGLANADRLGLAALALVLCFWIVDPLPASIYAKSNVAAAAHVVQKRLGANALVLSTQPEQVPTLAYYLPKVQHFGTPIGPVPDPQVVDWRNALKRFEHSRLSTVLVPMLNALTPGEKVALVVPTRLPNVPKYMHLIRHTSTTWLDYLREDPRLKLITRSGPHSGASGLPVEIYLFRQRY